MLGQLLCRWICSPLKKYRSVRSHELLPRKYWKIGLARLRVSRSFLQDLSRAVSRFSRGPVAGNHRQHFFDPTGSNTITFPDRICPPNIRTDRRLYSYLTQLHRKSVDGDFPQLGPWRSTKQLWIDLGEGSDSF